jgi:histidyl-tRNA synthetase
MDKLDRLGLAGVKELLGEGRKDESGDFTKGAGLKAAEIETVVRVFDPMRDSAEKFAQLDLGLRDSKRGQEGRAELESIDALVKVAGYRDDRIVIEPSVVRGLEYYTGAVYEVELTFPAPADAAQQGGAVRFGSVGGGGRYDGLIARFRGKAVPATGFSIGVSRLMAALQHLGKLAAERTAGPVVVTVFDASRIADYQNMVARLRGAGIRAELYLGGGKMGPQFKYADRRGAPCVVIQGGDEKARGEVQIKDLVEGAKAAAGIASHEEWRESRPAQFAVPEEKLIEAVREVLARHGVIPPPKGEGGLA